MLPIKTAKPKKSLGQNFLVDQRVVHDLVAAAEIGPEDVILEPGAGTGTVTKELAKRAGKVLAVEIDKELIPILKKNLRAFTNVEIVNTDVLKLLTFNFELLTFKVVGSIPYQITSPLIHKLLMSTPPPQVICMVIQKEVAQKIVATPPRATYLSNFVQAFAKAEIVRWIKPGAFRPQPTVDSAIIKITADRPPSESAGLLPQKFSKFLHRGFAHPRKMLNKIFPPEKLKAAGIRPQARAQELRLEDWITLLASEQKTYTSKGITSVN